MIFPYMKLRGKDLPIIPIMLEGSRDWISYDAFLDSGAGYSVFHHEVAENLGLQTNVMKKINVTVGDGSMIVVYTHPVKVEIGDFQIMAEIGFSKQLGIGFNIIGRKDIFDKFRICFEEKSNVIDITPI